MKAAKHSRPIVSAKVMKQLEVEFPNHARFDAKVRAMLCGLKGARRYKEVTDAALIKAREDVKRLTLELNEARIKNHDLGERNEKLSELLSVSLETAHELKEGNARLQQGLDLSESIKSLLSSIDSATYGKGSDATIKRLSKIYYYASLVVLCAGSIGVASILASLV